MPELIPYCPTDTLLKLEFFIDDEKTGLDSLLKDATVQFELNKIPFAKFTFVSISGSVDQDDPSPLAVFVRQPTDPPLPIEIKVSFEDEPVTLFKGIVKSVSPQVEGSQSVLKVECKDIALKLSHSSTVAENNNQTFGDKLELFTSGMTLSDNLKDQSWSAENITHNNATVPWDYLTGFLDSIGMMVVLRNAVFSGVDIIPDNAEAIYLAENGVNVFAFSGKVDDQKRKSSVTIQSWDIESQSVTTTEATQETPENPHVIRIDETPLTAETRTRIAKAALRKSTLAVIHGKVTTVGNLKAKIGDFITFKKVNDVIDGQSLLISQEVHTFENGCWKTEYAYGLESEQPFAQSTSAGVNNSHAETGQSNAVNGLMIGTVLQIEQDPGNQFRIRVRLPVISESGEGVWARLATLSASGNMGSYFIPDVGDEVIVGCLGNNPDAAIILGSVYSSAHKMPFPIAKENYTKGFVTKAGSKIIIDDEKKTITIGTAKNNTLTISDDLKGLVLGDQNGNKITMNDQGITIESCKDLHIKAVANIKTEGIQIAVEANAMLGLKGSVINLN